MSSGRAGWIQTLVVAQDAPREPDLLPSAQRHGIGRALSSVELICVAIRKRALLGFTYHGKRRVVAPYCCGVSHRGADVLRGVQVRGESASGGLGFGKLWLVAEIEGLRLLDEAFEPDDRRYNPRDSAMARVYCGV